MALNHSLANWVLVARTCDQRWALPTFWVRHYRPSESGVHSFSPSRFSWAPWHDGALASCNGARRLASPGCKRLERPREARPRPITTTIIVTTHFACDHSRAGYPALHKRLLRPSPGYRSLRPQQAAMEGWGPRPPLLLRPVTHPRSCPEADAFVIAEKQWSARSSPPPGRTCWLALGEDDSAYRVPARRLRPSASCRKRGHQGRAHS
jgi:hypothetical protein